MKAQRDYKPLFSILNGLRLDSERRYWIVRREADANICDIEGDTRQMSTGVEIVLQMSDKTLSCNTLTSAEEHIH